MSRFTKEEQLGLLKRGLERRLLGANSAIKQKEEEIEKINDIRKQYQDIIDNHQDEELIVNVFTAQLAEFDRQYAGTKQNFINAIEEIKESEPTAKKLLQLLDDKLTNLEILYPLLDLFFEPVLVDWHDMEEDAKKEEEKDVSTE